MRISTTRGIALYVGALLGPGLLVLPGLAAARAGPASILAWAGLLVLSGLVAIVFARFGIERPSAAGVAEYTAYGLGERAGRAVGWCFLAGIVTGAPIVCTMGAGYLAPKATALAGGLTLALMIMLSRRGLRASTGVQLALVAVLILVIVVAVGGAAPSAAAGNFRPFAPHGWHAIGGAATVLMLSFVGWEAVAPLTDRFADPRRQLPRVIGASFAITAVIYLALATITVAALGARAGTQVPMAALLTLAIGHAGQAVAAIAALLLTLGTVNAYLAGGTALARTLTGPPKSDAEAPEAAPPNGPEALKVGPPNSAEALKASPPSGAERPENSDTRPEFPRWFSAVLAGAGVVILGLIGAGVITVAGAITVPAAFFLVVYLGCMLSAVRAMPGRTRAIAVVAAAAILLILGYAGPAAIPAILVAAAAAVKVPAMQRPAISRGRRLNCSGGPSVAVCEGRRSGMESRRVISREAVVRGAARQFAVAGSVDMQTLAADLAISRATLYRVAGSRDALLGEALWTLGRRLLDVARAERVRPGVDGVIEVSRIFADRLAAAPPMQTFVGAEPDTAARVLFTPSGAVHRRIVIAQREVFVEAGVAAADLSARAFLYVRLMESVLYSDLISGRRVDFTTAEGALRALLAAA